MRSSDQSKLSAATLSALALTISIFDQINESWSFDLDVSQALDVCALNVILEPSKAPVGRFGGCLGLCSHVRQMRSFAGYITLIGDME